MKHQLEAPRAIKMSTPFKFIRLDLYLEEPASFFKVYRNDTIIRGVTSRLYVINVGQLHLSLETLRGPRDLGGKTDEVFNETASGDGRVHRRTL